MALDTEMDGPAESVRLGQNDAVLASLEFKKVLEDFAVFVELRCGDEFLQ
jgi:hypothetical protein